MNPTHERLLAALAEMCKLFPAWRVGQMICNLTQQVKFEESLSDPAGTIWEIEDEELLASIEEFVANRQRSLQTQQDPTGVS